MTVTLSLNTLLRDFYKKDNITQLVDFNLVSFDLYNRQFFNLMNATDEFGESFLSKIPGLKFVVYTSEVAISPRSFPKATRPATWRRSRSRRTARSRASTRTANRARRPDWVYGQV